tara:strand:- start:11524 stop:12486 length:963 start_codon:yes stop_codon:yes gene_type:complete
MTHIVLIGAGALGGRHLQSLISLGENVRVTVVDPSSDSLDMARTRVSEVISSVESVAEISFVEGLDCVPDMIDLAVIATGSAPRLNVLKSLLKVAKVKYVVLEKVLFQSLSDYDEASELLSDNGVQAWVNCPRRMFDAYSTLKLRLNNAQPILMEVIGGSWGLACNSIHFIDIFAFLTNSSILRVDTSNLEQSIFTSKRDGYIEFFGSLNVFFSSGHQLKLLCEHGNEAIQIKISDSHISYLINETDGTIYANDLKCDFDLRVRYQSELTQVFSEQILCFGHAKITSFHESLALHRPFIRALLDFYNECQNSSNTVLPIT